jgi:exodeoxyribonuclease V gamma subunit
LLTLYRSNRIEWLAQVLAAKLQADPPGPFEQAQVVVNTWPTSRWLGEQLALELGADPNDGAFAGGISANLRFPFPGSHLRRLVDGLPLPASPAEAQPAAASAASGPDPWRANQLVWPLLELLPELMERPEAGQLGQWLRGRGSVASDLEAGANLGPKPGQGLGPEADRGLGMVDRALWQLGRAIADAIDDYTLYRPAMVAAWCQGQDLDGLGKPLAEHQLWQPLLVRQLANRLGVRPFGLRVLEAIAALQRGDPATLAAVSALPSPLRLFGLSSMAPIQVDLLQALSGQLAVEIYLLTPCRDLWQRRGSGVLGAGPRSQPDQANPTPGGLDPGGFGQGLGANDWDPSPLGASEGEASSLDPLGDAWRLGVPSLEARFGRLGAEFQQLLEGSGETQLGESLQQDLFAAAAAIAEAGTPSQEPRPASLLEQLQQALVDPDQGRPLERRPGDSSLEFHACPGRLRQVQILRDRLLQLLAADASLTPRDILVMTPQVEEFAPLVAAVFGDTAATGIALPWRLTDRSQQDQGGLATSLLALLRLGGERLTASGLEALLSQRPLMEPLGLGASELGELGELLQRAGFRWGLDGTDRGVEPTHRGVEPTKRGVEPTHRGGDPTHSLAWAIDRLVLGLVLPEQPGLAPGGCAPLAMAGSLERQGRWLQLLNRLRHSLQRLAIARTPADWAPVLDKLLISWFGDGGERAWELQLLRSAIADWQDVAASSPLRLGAPVLAEVLAERLNADSGRFGHRSGSLTISALEPMRAIPHRVIVLMGLDGGGFPRQGERPGFHLMEQQRLLGDPNPGDQDRYVLLESLLSARDHLLVSWCSRDERNGDARQPAPPVRQWLALLEQQLGRDQTGDLLVDHSPNPLERANFLPLGPRPAPSCDRRLLAARQRLDGSSLQAPLALADRPASREGSTAGPEGDGGFDDLRRWLLQPQDTWLEQLGLRPREWDLGLDDFDPLELDERVRASLLRQSLDTTPSLGTPGLGRTKPVHPPDGTPDPAVPDPLAPPDWLFQHRGQGLLPARSAGILEAGRLSKRYGSLQQSLQALGPGERRLVGHGRLQAELLWHGEALVVWHSAQVRCAHHQELWLALVLATAAGAAPRRGLLIGRDGDQFRPVAQISPPASPLEAASLLEQLIAWRDQGRQHCWPLPPETGWAHAQAERRQAGSGRPKAIECWEGAPTAAANGCRPAWPSALAPTGRAGSWWTGLSAPWPTRSMAPCWSGWRHSNHEPLQAQCRPRQPNRLDGRAADC